VSEPDIRTAEEAKAYVQKLRAVMLYTGISDCKMNEGSLRCDVNLSVRKKGEQKLGTRTEMKNLNSFQFIVKAIEQEFARQVEAVEAGEAIIQETRRFDQASGKTFSMRRKEDANDYRYFPDPDLAPIEVSGNMLSALESEIPALPDQRKKEYVENYGLTAYGAEQITLQREIADYFELSASRTNYPKLAANIILSDVMRLLPPEETNIPIKPGHIASVAQMLGDGRINSGTSRELVQILWNDDQNPEVLVRERGMEQISDEGVLTGFIREVIAEQPKSVENYKKGKAVALQSLIGQVMKKTSGKGNPVKIQEIILKLINE
jgi:aspartyl-tRNA(Asn)/glutamyl-tRNA(Gln) amidotransferase subunit B